MAENTDDGRREKGLEFAYSVDRLAMTAPDAFAESVIHKAAHLLRRRYGYSRKLKKAEILRQVRANPYGVTLGDLIERLRFNRPDVSALVGELVEEGKVTRASVMPAGSKGGRPVVLLMPPEEGVL